MCMTAKNRPGYKNLFVIPTAHGPAGQFRHSAAARRSRVGPANRVVADWSSIQVCFCIVANRAVMIEPSLTGMRLEPR